MAKEAVASTEEEEDEVMELPTRYHSDGCPENPDRLEWEDITPTTGKLKGQKCEYLRCVDCGGELVRPTD